MPKIHKLAPHEAQKIAAGEVVERPANIAKELIENAIDAGATTITIYVERGGKDLIRVIDNGCGMSLDDAYLCFEHHATSKISCVEDLQNINTFGFRGEALSSICAISKVILITKPCDTTPAESLPVFSQGSGGHSRGSGTLEAIKLELEHGMPTNQSFVSGNTGTDISIRDVFYNVPARQKFLKSDDTEWRAIQQLCYAFCLDYLNIQFKLYHNNNLQINCAPTNDFITRMSQLWEYSFSSQMIPVSSQRNQGAITIHGAISNHQYMRYDRNNIFFFVNKRWVKQQKLSSALIKGYLNVLPPARFPAAAIFIEIDPSQVDINIHPRKEEVQFLHPRVVEQCITEMVKKALETHLSDQLKKPSIVTQYTKDIATFAPATQVLRTFHESTPKLHFNSIGTISVPSLAIAKSVNNKAVTENEITTVDQKDQIQTQHTIASAVQKVISNSSDAIILEKNYTFIGIMQKTYLLLEKEEGLYIIDQHAAHERILYELFSKRFDTVSTINLMFPHCITLKPEDLTLLEPHISLFTTNGIGIEMFGNDQLMVTSTPVHLKNQSIEDLVHLVIGWINETQTTDSTLFFKTINEKLHAQMACKAAVKAGDTLNQEQIDQLLHDLHATDNRFTCPHGRPTGWLLSTYEIEKKFKRKL